VVNGVQFHIQIVTAGHSYSPKSWKISVPKPDSCDWRDGVDDFNTKSATISTFEKKIDEKFLEVFQHCFISSEKIAKKRLAKLEKSIDFIKSKKLAVDTILNDVDQDYIDNFDKSSENKVERFDKKLSEVKSIFDENYDEVISGDFSSINGIDVSDLELKFDFVGDSSYQYGKIDCSADETCVKGSIDVSDVRLNSPEKVKEFLSIVKKINELKK